MLPVLQEAGQIAKDYRRRADADFAIMIKKDGSKVTGGDLAVHEFLAREIPKITPDIPVASEEDPASHIDYGDHPYWVLDPIDGTNNFINGRASASNDYSILAAIVQNRLPQLGLVYGPESETLYIAMQAGGAYKVDDNNISNPRVLKTRTWEKGDDIIIGTTHYFDTSPYKDFLKQSFERAGFKPIFQKFEPTISRICNVAEGIVDVYATALSSPAGEWDIAAAHVVLNEAGGGVMNLKDLATPVRYGNPAQGMTNIMAVSDMKAAQLALTL